MTYRPVVISAAFLFLFAVIGSGLVAFTHDNTAERIAENQRRALLRSLNELIPKDQYDNDVYADILYVHNSELLGTDEAVPVYRARKGGWPVAVVLAPVAPDGYNGNIRLLVAVRLDGTLAGVRVLAHRETPGLGDNIEADRSDWIRGFTGKSLNNPKQGQWKVKRDGGAFDQFTGATITPRAVVKAVKNTLLYYRANGDKLFEQHPHENQQS
ncbi:MAG: electron transport complex subunit RsxG [Thiogranum sp.]|jgi:electron transport complex protein RnfG